MPQNNFDLASTSPGALLDGIDVKFKKGRSQTINNTFQFCLQKNATEKKTELWYSIGKETTTIIPYRGRDGCLPTARAVGWLFIHITIPRPILSLKYSVCV